MDSSGSKPGTRHGVTHVRSRCNYCCVWLFMSAHPTSLLSNFQSIFPKCFPTIKNQIYIHLPLCNIFVSSPPKLFLDGGKSQWFWPFLKKFLWKIRTRFWGYSKYMSDRMAHQLVHHLIGDLQVPPLHFCCCKIYTGAHSSGN